MDAEQIRSAVRLGERRIDEASAAVAVHLEDVPAVLLDDLHGAFEGYRRAERDRLVYELGRHLPGVRPALLALTEHIGEGSDTLDRVGTCCHDD